MGSSFDLTTLTKTIEGLSTRILDYALVLAAVGTIAMALIELVKALTFSRLLFHRLMIARWLGDDASLRSELLTLAAGGPANANALYDQPSEKLMAQVQAAANVALDFPMVYPRFYAFLTTGSAAAGAKSDQEKWREFAPKLAQGVPADPGARATFEQESRDSTQARARLGNLVTRRLDAVQTRIDYVWARLNQILAVAAGALILSYSLPSTIPEFTRFVMSVTGGLIAPFAKDVVNKLTGLQARR